MRIDKIPSFSVFSIIQKKEQRR